MGKTAEELLDTEWWRAGDAEVLTNLAEIEMMVHRLQAHALLAINTAEQRGLVESTQYGLLRELLRDALHITRREAQRRPGNRNRCATPCTVPGHHSLPS